MTTDIERQFFDTFGINPKYTYLVTDIFYTNNSHTYMATKEDLIDYFEGKNCGRYKVIKVYKNYPKIRDRVLLELICILSSNPIRILFESMLSGIKEVELLKNSILLTCIANKDVIKQQVQVLFKEGNNEKA